MRIGNITSTDRPDEFALAIVGGSIISAEWRTDITETEEPAGFTAKVLSVAKCAPATSGEATRLLMLCKYPDPSAECAILRRGADDAERIEHETYHDRVAAFVAGLFN